MDGRRRKKRVTRGRICNCRRGFCLLLSGFLLQHLLFSRKKDQETPGSAKKSGEKGVRHSVLTLGRCAFEFRRRRRQRGRHRPRNKPENQQKLSFFSTLLKT
jgi:hypothetical protein